MNHDPAFLIILAVVSLTLTLLVLDFLFKRLLRLVMPHYGYVWYEAYAIHQKDKVVQIPGGFINQDVQNYIHRLESLVDELRFQNDNLSLNKTAVDKKTGQMSFAPIVPNLNGHKPVLEYNNLLLTFRNEYDRMCFARPEEYVWVERITRSRHGKNDREYTKRWYGWVRIDESLVGNNYFDPQTDTELLTQMPPVWPNQPNKGDLIPNDFHHLPFTWQETENEVTPFSVAQYELLFKDKGK